MSLEKLENGKRGVVCKIDGGEGARDHLLQLGIVPGVPVRMIQQDKRGPILVEVLGTKVMLGRKIAEKVLVS